jgi:hypothetical protein
MVIRGNYVVDQVVGQARFFALRIENRDRWIGRIVALINESRLLDPTRSLVNHKIMSTSPIKIKQEPDLEDSCQIMPTPSQTVDPTNLIFFAADKPSKLNYPIGCPVWYNIHDVGLNQLSFCRGRVCGVAMDVVSHKVVCKIQKIDSDDFTTKDNDTALVFEDEITYGMGCPVIINLEGEEFDGDIACTFRTPNGDGTMDVTYSVVTDGETNRSKVVHGLNSHQVKYRRTDDELTETNAQTVSGDMVVPDVVAISKDQESATRESVMTRSPSQNHVGQLRWEPPTDEKRRAIADSDNKLMSDLSRREKRSDEKKRAIGDSDGKLKSDLSHRNKRSRKTSPFPLSFTYFMPSWVLKAAGGSTSLIGTLHNNNLSSIRVHQVYHTNSTINFILMPRYLQCQKAGY